jgi:hypothetical protein
MWPWKRKLDKEKSKHVGLAQQNGFGPTFFCRGCQGWYKVEYNLTPAVDWLDSLIGLGELLLLKYLSWFVRKVPNNNNNNNNLLFIFSNKNNNVLQKKSNFLL